MTEYLALVRPIEIFFSSEFKCGGFDDLKKFMWADYIKGVWSGDKVSDLLKLYTGKYKMPSLGFREYRQVAIAFMEKHMKYKVDDCEWSEDNILDLQAGHSSETATRMYAGGATDHQIITRDALHK